MRRGTIRIIPVWGASALLVMAACVLATCRDRPPADGEAAPSAAVTRATPAPKRTHLIPRTAPDDPADMPSDERPAVVLLHAPWCQWCRVLETEVLPDAAVREVLVERFTFYDVDVDRAPRWMDLHGVQGLPSMVFFDPDGRHVLTRSGYRPATDMEVLLEAVADRIEVDGYDPYPHPRLRRIGDRPISAADATAELRRLEKEIFLRINSNDGGFATPARQPRPDTLLALQRWRETGGPPRIDTWIETTAENALRGGSPRLRGEPLDDMTFDGDELTSLSKHGAEAGKRWREGIDRLPEADPYLGLQDPVDHGVFRYAAGPGWYHPHFERRAIDNRAWAMLLRRRGDREGAAAILSFVEDTFGDDSGLLRAAQASDPFYYRLREEERVGIPAPPVDRLWSLKVQARAARALPSRCEALLRLSGDRWPAEQWTTDGERGGGAEATADAVGELLLALSACGSKRHREIARRLVETVNRRFADGLPETVRLHRLVAGICAVDTGEICGRALDGVRGIALGLEHPPPLAALQRFSE